MPERLRTLVNHLRRFVSDRRHAPRYPAHLPATVSHVSSAGNARHHAGRPAPILSGHTRDLSATGISLVLPAIRIGDRYLMGEGRPVQITLELPTGAVQLRAVPMRYERLGDEEGGERGYLVGAHIMEMDPDDMMRFGEFVRELAKG
ncbi:MAG TPA: PilZ domain-containing protein [Pyrinomonadaceae bacterium]